MNNLFRYGTVDSDTILRADLTTDTTLLEDADSATTMVDTFISPSASYGAAGFNAAGGSSGGHGLRVDFSTEDGAALASNGTIIFEVESAALYPPSGTHDDFMFTFGLDNGNPDNHATPYLPSLGINTGTRLWRITQDSSSEVSTSVRHITTGQDYSIPTTVEVMWTWTETKAYLFVDGLLEIGMDRVKSATADTDYKVMCISGWAQSGGRGMTSAIRRVQVLKRTVPIPTRESIEFVGLLGSSYLVANGQAVHPQYHESAQTDIYWAKHAGTGFDSTSVGGADIPFTVAPLAGFDHGFLVGLIKNLQAQNIFPKIINRAQSGGEVSHATGVSNPTSDNFTLADGHYLRLIADTVAAGGTVPEALICDLGTNEVNNGTSPLFYERGYKALLRKASTDGVKLAVLHTVASMTVSSGYDAVTNDDEVGELNAIVNSLPAWAKAEGLDITIVIANTFASLGGYFPKVDYFNTNNIHPNETGGDIQGATSASAFGAGVLAIESSNTSGGVADGGVTAEYLNSTNYPTGRDFGTKRYQDDGDIIPNYIHTDFPNR